MIRSILRRFGYVKIDHGSSCGRHWVSIDGKMIYQASGADLWMPDDFTQSLAIIADPACEWALPLGWKALNTGRDAELPVPEAQEIAATVEEAKR